MDLRHLARFDSTLLRHSLTCHLRCGQSAPTRWILPNREGIMSFLCCMGNGRENNVSIASSKNPHGKEVFMDDLVLHPKSIDAKLEGKIAEWESALHDYQAFEDICREEIEAELTPILEDLRDRPRLYKNKNYSVNVQTLAAKLMRVHELQARLETSSRDDDSSSLSTMFKYYCCFLCITSHARKTESEPNPRDTVHVSTNLSMSEKLSERWALRLNEIDPTQGSLQRTTSMKNPAQNAPIRIKPKWPDFLIDTYFDVIKINMYGRKMRRIIKLTQHYVVNITNGEEISKFYAYREIRRVWLESNNMIVVVLKCGKQSVYMSHIAPHVLQQITTRVQVRRSLDNAEYHGPSFNLGYSAAVTAGIIKNISEENTLDSEAVVALFANELKERTVRSIAGAAADAEMKSNRSSINTLPSLVEQEEESGVGEGGGGVGSMGEGSGDSESGNEDSPAVNPLHLSANLTNTTTTISTSTTNTTDTAAITTTDNTTAPATLTRVTSTKIDIIPPMPNFSSPFTNSIQNSSDIPLDRKASHNSATSEGSENTFHTADSTPVNPLTFGTTTNTTSTSTTPSADTANTTPVPVVSETPRLLSFKEGMPEFSVQSALQTLIFDASTSEGNTRKLFIDKFKSACIASIVQSGVNGRPVSLPQGTLMSKTKSIKGATLVEVRHFIDGMHEYILGNRGVSLSLLYEREKQRSMILHTSSANSSNKEGDGENGGPGAPGASPGGRGITRGNSKRSLLARGKSMDAKNNTDLKTFTSPHSTATNDHELTSRASLQFLKDNNLDLSMIDEKVVVFISFIIFMVVEEAIFLPLKADLINLLPSSSKLEEEQTLLEKMKALSTRTQQQWGIPDDLVSPLGWQTAIFELQGLEHNLTPSTQLHVLTRTVKAVYNEFKHVILPQQQARGQGASCIAADDLVPIFIFIFCRSNLKHPMRSRDLMWSLCHPDQLQGEGGYYLTVFESSIEFVLNEEISRESFAYNYATPSTSAADEASTQYIHGLRNSHSAHTSHTHDKDNKTDKRASGGRSLQDGDALVGTPFDISSDFHDAGLVNSRGSGGWGSIGARLSSNSNHSGSSPSHGSPSKSSSRVTSSSSATSASEALRHSAVGRDSMLSTLAQRLTLSNLLTRKPAPDNTTRESFN